MQIGIKRLTGYEEKAVHVVDPLTGRGFILHSGLYWKNVVDADISGKASPRQMADFLNQERYFPGGVPDEEFSTLYEKLKARRGLPLFRNMGDFNPDETPTLKSLIEESDEAYTRRVIAILLENKTHKIGTYLRKSEHNLMDS